MKNTSGMKGKGGKCSHGVAPQHVTAPKALTDQHLMTATSNPHKQQKQNKKRPREEAAKARDPNNAADSHLPVAKKVKTTSSSDTLKPPLIPQSARGNAGFKAAKVTTQSDPLGLLSKFRASYEVTDINVISSTQIKPKVNKILETLSAFPYDTLDHTKLNVISIHARALTASKMISIVEIAKREIVKAGGKWYQYSGLSQVVEEKKKNMSEAMRGEGHVQGRAPPTKDDVTEEREEEEESCFETMKTPLERALQSKPKIRAVPVMTIYLSRVRIDSLEQAYGEQTNDTNARACA